MYSETHAHEVKVEKAWREYITALEDVTVTYSKVAKLREVFYNLVNSKPKLDVTRW